MANDILTYFSLRSAQRKVILKLERKIQNLRSRQQAGIITPYERAYLFHLEMQRCMEVIALYEAFPQYGNTIQWLAYTQVLNSLVRN